MNIFFLDNKPKVAAQMMHDKHVVKMILESAQMLCTAYHELGYTKDIPYKKAYVNHPMTIWTRTSSANFNWLIQHSLELCKIYTEWRDRTHKTEQVIRWCDNNKHELSIFNDSQDLLTQRPKCMPDAYKSQSVVESYLLYYITEKIKPNSAWTDRPPPDLFIYNRLS